MDKKGFAARFAYRGGNCNNSLHVGTFYCNLNNTPSNANWNIGTAHSIQNSKRFKCPASSAALAENEHIKRLLVASRKWTNG